MLLALPLPAIQIPLLDGINKSTLVYQVQGNLASALVVCVCGGGGGAGYVKIVMTGMCGPNLASALVDVCVGGGRGWQRKNCYDGDVRT